MMRIGIDLGGTKIEGALVRANGEIEHAFRMPTPQGDYLATLKVVAQLVEKLDCLVGQILPIGMATPGTVSRVTGKMKNCNSTCLNGRALKEDLADMLHRDIRLANDADCFVLSEAIGGAGEGVDILFGVILGTGVGGGICYRGELFQGAHGIAGEWGHNPMPPLIDTQKPEIVGKRACYCGRVDCIETYLSGPAFERTYLLATSEELSAAAIVEKAVAGDGRATAHLDRYQENLAAALATVINLLDPDVIVLGGGMSQIDSLYAEVPKRWQKYVFSDECTTALRKPVHGDSSGIRGAAWLWPDC